MTLAQQRARLVVAPTDFSEAADLALREAMREATARGATLLLVHVIEAPVYFAPAHPLPQLLVISEQLRSQAEHELGARAERVRRAGVACETQVCEGAPAEAILRVLEQRNPELVVMPTQSLRGLGRFLFGSVFDRVLRSTRTPVLVLPPGATGES
jgi:nucleotide-binding universal stress UspA family protein